MFGERAFEKREVEPSDVLGDIDERVVGNCVEEDVGVAQAQIEVDENDGVIRVFRERAADIHGQTRGAHAAGGAANGDDHAAARFGLAPPEAALANPLERADQVLESHRLGEEFFRPRPHRSQDERAVA